MKILMVGSDPRQGLIYYHARLARELVRQGQEVLLAVGSDGEQTEGLRCETQQAGVRLASLRCLARGGVRALVGPSRESVELVRAERPDVVHAWGPVSLRQLRARGGERIPRVAMVAAMAHHANPRSFRVRTGAAMLNRYARIVLAQCREEERRLAVAGVAKDRIRVVYPPLACDEFLARAEAGRTSSGAAVLRAAGVDESAAKIGYFANFEPRKRHDMLVRAFHELREELKGWTLVLAGEGPTRDGIEALVTDMGLSQRVMFLGRQQNVVMPSLLANMDLVVHCSNAETFGYSIVEPILLRVPTVLTRTGIAREIEENTRIPVVPPDDGHALVTAIRETAIGAAQRGGIAAEAAAYVRRTFDVAVIALRLTSLYAEVVGA